MRPSLLIAGLRRGLESVACFSAGPSKGPAPPAMDSSKQSLPTSYALL
jgi:hypothetical protein